MGLQPYLNWLTLDGLDEPAMGWLRAIEAAGYEGIQFIEPLDPLLVEGALKLGLKVCGSGRVNRAEDAARLAAEARVHGLACLTLHVGWGMESEAEGLRLIDAVLEATHREGVAMHVETHRATLFQDIWRTVEFLRRRPELTFNADLSHWYTGLEFVYGGLGAKLDFITPVIERVEFMHGRIGTPGCIQVDLGERPAADALPYVEHFRQMWSRRFAFFIARHGADAPFPFAAELLSANIHYARRFGGREESDRWAQSALLIDLARDWYREAVSEGVAARQDSRAVISGSK
jgi:hypothetical protein